MGDLTWPNKLSDAYPKLIFTKQTSGTFSIYKSDEVSSNEDVQITNANLNIVGNVTGNLQGNSSGSHTGDVVGNVTGNVSGNAGTVTNGVYTTGNQTIDGEKTFTQTIVSNLTGNVSGNLTGDVFGCIEDRNWTGVTIPDNKISSASTWNAKQESHSSLTNLVTLSTDGTRGNADNIIYSTSSDGYAVSLLTPFGKTWAGLLNAGAGRTELGVDAAGTDNSTNVTITSNAFDYITLSDQELTLRQVDLAVDVQGSLPDSNISSASTWDAKLDKAGSPSDGEYARYDSSGLLEGINTATLLSDLGISSNAIIDWTATSQGTIHQSNLPAITLNTVQTAANEAAQLALIVQEGDVIVRSDENKSYMRNDGSSGTMADFTLLATPTDAVLSVDGNTGAVTLNHDTLSGFVANEHIDWSADGAGTIHASNYTNTTYTASDFLDVSNDANAHLELKCGSNGEIRFGDDTTADSVYIDVSNEEIRLKSSTGYSKIVQDSGDTWLVNEKDTGSGALKLLSDGNIYYNSKTAIHEFYQGGASAAAKMAEISGATDSTFILWNIGTDSAGLTMSTGAFSNDATIDSAGDLILDATNSVCIGSVSSNNTVATQSWVNQAVETATDDIPVDRAAEINKAKMFARIF